MTAPQTVSELADRMRDGDLVFFKGTSLISKVIAAMGGCPVTHVGMIAKVDLNPRAKSVLLLEMREFIGGRMVSLANEVENRKGEMYWIPLDPLNRFDLDRDAIVDKMVEFTGKQYNYWQVIRAGISHLPFLRFFFKPSLEDVLSKDLPLFCSACCGYAIQHGGHDTVHFLANAWTEPCDLYRSLIHDGNETQLKGMSQPR